MQQCYTEIAAATTRGRCDTEDADESEEFCANWSYEIYLNDQQTDAVFECVTPAASGLYCEVSWFSVLLFQRWRASGFRLSLCFAGDLAQLLADTGPPSSPPPHQPRPDPQSLSFLPLPPR